MDREWIKHLALASLEGGEWRPQDRHILETKVRARLRDIMQEFLAAAEESAAIYNVHAHHGRRMSVLPVRESALTKISAIVFLLGRVQLRLEDLDGTLSSNILTLQGFERRQSKLYLFDPRVDAFGSITWVKSGERELTIEGVIQQCMADVVRAALTTHEIA